jgi:hypothetical protein
MATRPMQPKESFDIRRYVCGDCGRSVVTATRDQRMAHWVLASLTVVGQKRTPLMVVTSYA